MHQKAQLGGVRHRACTRCDAVESKHDLLQARIGIYEVGEPCTVSKVDGLLTESGLSVSLRLLQDLSPEPELKAESSMLIC